MNEIANPWSRAQMIARETETSWRRCEGTGPQIALANHHAASHFRSRMADRRRITSVAKYDLITIGKDPIGSIRIFLSLSLATPSVPFFFNLP